MTSTFASTATRLLIGFDGSQASAEALRVLSRREFAPGTEIRLVFVNDGKLNESERQAVQKRLEDAVFMLDRGDCSIKLEWVLGEGNVRDVLLEQAQSWPADLIVVGSRGQSMLQNVLLGSVSQALLGQSKCPVLVAREVQPQAVGNVLVALDDSEFSAAAIEWLGEQPWARGKSIALTSIVEPQEESILGMHAAEASRKLMTWQEERSLIRLALEYWENYLRQRLPQSDIRSGIIDGDIRDIIVKAANNWPAEVVVMGSHGRSGWKKLVMGSVSQNVAGNANSSVEVVRGVVSKHYAAVQALIEERRANSPLQYEPTKQDMGWTSGGTPVRFFW